MVLRTTFIFKQNRLDSAVSQRDRYTTIRTLFCLTVFCIAGFIYDVSDRYDIPFYVVGVCDAIGASLTFLSAFLASKHTIDRNDSRTSE